MAPRLDPYKRLLPAPPWRTLVFFFSGLTTFPTGAVWLPFLPDCGDVESNPGPDQGAAFHTFAISLADVFIPACDHLIMARAVTSLHGTMTSAGLTVKDVASLLAIPGDSADDCLRLAAAYSLYANLSLTFPDGIPTWSSLSPPAPPKDSQIELLLQKIHDLELRRDVPQEPPVDPFLPLSESAIKNFSLLPGRPRWMTPVDGPALAPVSLFCSRRTASIVSNADIRPPTFVTSCRPDRCSSPWVSAPRSSPAHCGDSQPPPPGFAPRR